MNATNETKGYESEETASEREAPADILTLDGYTRATTAWLNKAADRHSGVTAYDAQIAIDTITTLRERLLAARTTDQSDRTFDRLEAMVEDLGARIERIEERVEAQSDRLDHFLDRLDSNDDDVRALRTTDTRTADMVEGNAQNVARLENGLVRTLTVLQKVVSKTFDLDANLGLINLAAPMIIEGIEQRITDLATAAHEDNQEIRRVVNVNAESSRKLRDSLVEITRKLHVSGEILGAASGASTGVLAREMDALRDKLVEVFPFLKRTFTEGEKTTGDQVREAAMEAGATVALNEMLREAGFDPEPSKAPEPCPVHG